MDTRVDQHRLQRLDMRQERDLVADPLHTGGVRRAAHRHICAQLHRLRRWDRDSLRSCKGAQHRRGIGRAAANARLDRQVFV